MTNIPSLVLALAQKEPSDTFYTHAPEWTWLVVVYFFVGGIAGGSAFLGAMLDLFGAPQDRPIARLAYLVALPLITIGGPLLIWDLNRPERFWHMFIQSETGRPMFKYWSPISFGAWGVGAFGLFALLAGVGALAEMGLLPRALRALREGPLGKIISALAGLFGLFVAGYTGILLAATNRPLWADTSLLGLLFLLSSISAAAAALILLSWRRGHPGSLHWLSQMDAYSSVLELVTLIVIVVSLGSVVREVWGNGWGVLLAVGTVLLGILIPLALHFRPRLAGRMSLPGAAALVLIGAFVLRAVVVLSSEAV
ncbi:MAG: polysulfide reductase NrfD [Chloroflexota bacterium]|nr:polysulfide reductase NrfD [Chloroflexota bacterium]